MQTPINIIPVIPESQMPQCTFNIVIFYLHNVHLLSLFLTRGFQMKLFDVVALQVMKVLFYHDVSNKFHQPTRKLVEKVAMFSNKQLLPPAYMGSMSFGFKSLII